LVESDRLMTPVGLEQREDIRKGIEFDKWSSLLFACLQFAE